MLEEGLWHCGPVATYHMSLNIKRPPIHAMRKAEKDFTGGGGVRIEFVISVQKVVRRNIHIYS
jgi:hypothetical protein